MNAPSPDIARDAPPRGRRLPAGPQVVGAPGAQSHLAAAQAPPRRAPSGGSPAALRWLAAPTGRGGIRTFRVRLVVQGLFAALSLLLGWQFARFVAAARAGADALPARPGGVEGFLPISGLIGVLDWMYTGALNTIHPAATVLLLIFVALAFLLRKAFCSWICPVGLLSEALARAGRRVIGRNLRAPVWLDVALRGLKYGLLAFFLWAILGMRPAALHGFIDSPYNRVADVKMLLFFQRPGTTTLVVLSVLALASAVVAGAWCRYLCPYGALLGLFSRLSPAKVRRHAPSCIDCGMCDRACLARLPVSRSLAVASAECTGCLDCVASCPVPDTLTFGGRRRRIGVLGFAAALLLLFAAGYGGARLAGRWTSGLPPAEMRERIQKIDDAAYSHPGI